MKNRPHEVSIKFVAVLVLAMLVFESALATERFRPKPPIKVMTQNLYIGADLDILLEPEVAQPIQYLVAEFLETLESTNFPERAEALAAEIQKYRPDVIGLQEAALVRFQGTGDFLAGTFFPNADITLLDYVEILLDALKARNLRYRVASMIRNTDVELPAATDLDENGRPDDIRVTDRDVILTGPGVSVSNATSATYNVLRVFVVELAPGLTVTVPVKRGVTAVNARVRGRTHRVANTHLENSGDDPSIQAAQASDLIGELSSQAFPVVLLGDFNSGPTDPAGSPYEQLMRAGFLDAWKKRRVRHGTANEPGFTCCQEKDLLNPESILDRRFDLVLFRPRLRYADLLTSSVRAVVAGDDPDDKTPSGLWPSDHAGVVAKIRTR